MKIALATEHVNSFGGVPSYVSNLARALARHHEVTIFSQTFEEMGDTAVRHRRIRVAGDVARFEDIATLHDERFDIIHGHHYEYPFVSDVLTSHYCELEGVERLAPRSALGISGDSATSRRNRAKARLERDLLASHAGKPLIVLADGMRDEFVRHYGIPAKQIFVIHSGVDSDRFSPRNLAIYRDEVRKLHGLGNEPVLLLVGGDWERKGVAEAIRALSLLTSRDAKLLIAGPGDAGAYGRLANALHVEDRVIFAGQTRESWKYYAAGDIFLLPTKYEAFGLAILEAMATGLPVLVSVRAGAAELIRDGVNGMHIEGPTDSAAIAAKIESLLKDRDLRRRLGHHGRLTALEYNWDRVAEQTANVYDRAVSRSKRHPYVAAATPAI